MELVHSGKIRDVYADGDDVILVASDRVSVYDVVLPTPIPDKGKLLTQLSLWWFQQLAEVTPHHVISGTDVPPRWTGRAVRCRRLDMIEVECIARGYLAGLGLREYQKSGTVSGILLPPGLVEGSKLPEPIFTPTTKSAPGAGVHDEFIEYGDVVNQVGADTADRLRRITLEVYRRGAEQAARQGIIIADTKLEFGWASDDGLVLGDELLTSDSSRFWPADQWEPGRPQFAFDKQFVRDWAAATGWDKRPPAPAVPAEIVAATQARYTEVYERITSNTWSTENQQ
ncbi:MAG: phosphoribosylaminoimidazolesuccinocarboxamide synthase [Natronosporangium sp.]